MIQNEANNLVEKILPFERELFLWLNDLHNSFWNSFMWIYSDKFTWIPLAIVALGVFTYKIEYKKSILLILCIALTFTLCDQLSASVIKPFFERYRPTHHPDFSQWVNTVNNYTGGRYGFVSAHAANGFGIALFLSLVFRYRYLTITLFTWALTTSYSRIYLGVHFISDVIGGMIVGVLVGVFVFQVFRYARKYILKESDVMVQEPFYTIARANILCITILVLVLSIVVISLMNFMYGFRWLY